MPVCSSFCVLICLCAQLSVRSFFCVLICLCAHLSECSSVCTFCPSVFVYSSSVCVSITLWSLQFICLCVHQTMKLQFICLCVHQIMKRDTKRPYFFLAAITKIIQVTAVKITLWNKQSRFKHLSTIKNKNKTRNN